MSRSLWTSSRPTGVALRGVRLPCRLVPVVGVAVLAAPLTGHPVEHDTEQLGVDARAGWPPRA